ncbi:MAG: tyrosine-type recombinase/integrase [Streptomyces turgidiscabies]|nr:tyrosine-type recombinase/integrase [Streptomyces turgidiscabies]
MPCRVLVPHKVDSVGFPIARTVLPVMNGGELASAPEHLFLCRVQRAAPETRDHVSRPSPTEMAARHGRGGGGGRRRRRAGHGVPVRLDAAVKRAGYVDEPWTAHTLRHFFASSAIAGGVSLLEVSRWLGHATIQITADIYGHLTPDAGGRLRSVMDQVLRGVSVVGAESENRAGSVLSPGAK